MTTKTLVLSLIAAGVLAAGGYGAYLFGMNQGMQMTDPIASASAAASGGSDSAGGKKVLYWHDPMVPGPKFDKPGRSPFMDMDLVPVYADEGVDEGTVSISPRVQQNLGIRTDVVTRGDVSQSIKAVGSVAYNERDLVMVQARNNGYVEKLYARATLDPVRRGQALAEVYVPEWVAAQEEYLTVKQMGGDVANGLLDAARQRMRLAGMTDAQIRLVARGGKVVARQTIRSPINGVVSELSAREGMTVMSGAELFQINGLRTVWVEAELPENVAGQVKPGTPVEATSQALPGEALQGKVSAILPQIDLSTRTLKARIELENPNQRLVPGMFVTVDFAPVAKKDVLTVPTEAVIRTGTRDVVIVVQDEGKFAPVEVEIGTEVNGKTVVRKGLEAGQKVVTSGQFLIDSEASLKGAINRMSDMPELEEGKAGADVHQGEGTVESVEDGEVTLAHGPIPSLKWGEMTMGFKLPKDGLPKDIKDGDKVAFTIRPMKDGMYEIVEIAPAGSATKQAPGSEGAGAAPDQKKDGSSSPANTKAPDVHRGEGKVESIDEDGITLSHGPIPSLKWGPMTMGFEPPQGGVPKSIAVGDTVVFDFRTTEDGTYQIVQISPVKTGAKGTGQ
jgi:Cu(I)/Ag(I) efflux system membrane fusion protein